MKIWQKKAVIRAFDLSLRGHVLQYLVRKTEQRCDYLHLA